MNKSCDRIIDEYVISIDEVLCIKNNRYIQTFIEIVEEFLMKNCIFNPNIHDANIQNKKNQEIFFKNCLLYEKNNVPILVYKYLFFVFKEKIKYLNKEARRFGLSLKEITKTYLYLCKKHLNKNKNFNMNKDNFVDQPKQNFKRMKVSSKKIEEDTDPHNQFEKEKEEKRKNEEKRRIIKIMPKNFILGNLNKVNNHLDKKITIFKGQFVRTFVMNVDRNLYLRMQENIKYQQSSMKNENPDILYDDRSFSTDNKIRISSSFSVKKKINNNNKQEPKDKICNKSYRDNSREINSSNSIQKYEFVKNKDNYLPNIKLQIIEKNNSNLNKELDFIKPTLISNIAIYKNGVNNKAKSVKKLIPRSFFENSDFYYI